MRFFIVRSTGCRHYRRGRCVAAGDPGLSHVERQIMLGRQGKISLVDSANKGTGELILFRYSNEASDAFIFVSIWPFSITKSIFENFFSRLVKAIFSNFPKFSRSARDGLEWSPECVRALFAVPAAANVVRIGALAALISAPHALEEAS